YESPISGTVITQVETHVARGFRIIDMGDMVVATTLGTWHSPTKTSNIHTLRGAKISIGNRRFAGADECVPFFYGLMPMLHGPLQDLLAIMCCQRRDTIQALAD
ncbi:hypothetical protein TNCV_4687091, partial [Trichonephila clavipes]